MRRSVVAVVGLALVSLPGCRDDTVRVTFRPEVGTTYRYAVTVRSSSTTSLSGQPTQRSAEGIELVAEHTVLEASREGVRVHVVLGRPGGTAQTFVVRFDRAGQLESVEDAEGAGGADHVLGLGEIFPAALGAPPERRLAPGDRWEIDEDVEVPGGALPAHLLGAGQLTELDVEGGRELARVRTSATLALLTRSQSASSSVLLDGRQQLRQRATYDLADGALRASSATTTGRFRLAVTPAGAETPVVPGTLVVEVRSTTRRLAS